MGKLILLVIVIVVLANIQIFCLWGFGFFMLLCMPAIGRSITKD